MNRVRQRHMPRRHSNGGDKSFFGFLLLLAGTFILLKKLDLLNFSFHSMWPWAVILIGTMIGVKSKFRNNAWWILIAIGTMHLIPVFTILGVSSKALLIPVLLILLGLVFIFRPQNKKKLWNERCEGNIKTVTSSDSLVNVDVTFGGHKEVITSKDFKGGNISTTFGGAEINMMAADSIEKTITLNIKASFGGIELIVPSHWVVKNEISTTLGNVEDNRQIYTQGGDTKDTITLVLTGSCNFGNIEIKSY